MFQPGKDSSDLIEEFRQRPYGPHSPALQALLTWLRTRPRERKLVVLRQPASACLQLCELGGGGVQLTVVVHECFATLEDAERAAFDIRWRENCPDFLLPTGEGS